MTVSLDHRGFHLHGSPFYPLIEHYSQQLSSWSNAVIIPLDGSPSSDLQWKGAHEKAQEVVAASKWIVWDLDLGLSTTTIIPEDMNAFQGHLLAVEQYCKDILSQWAEHTLCVIVYCGSLDFSSLFPRKWWEPLFLQTSQEISYQLFSGHLLAQYLHRLTAALPDGIAPVALFDAIAEPFSKVARLFFSEQFKSVSVGLKGVEAWFPGISWGKGGGTFGYIGSSANEVKRRSSDSIAVLLAVETMWDEAFDRALDSTVQRLMQEGQEFRLIAAERLHQEWDGVDEVILPSSSHVTTQLNRQLQGFLATGGTVRS